MTLEQLLSALDAAGSLSDLRLARDAAAMIRILAAERDAQHAEIDRLRVLLQADRDTFHALDCRGGLGYEAHDRIGVRIAAIDTALAGGNE